MEISKDCVMVMTSVWLHDRSSCKPLEKSLRNGLRSSKPITSEFGAIDEKELKIVNRTIKIDVLNDEMTLEADTKLVENALESMKLNGGKSVDSPRVRRTEEQTAQIEDSDKLTSVESTFVSQFGDEVGVCCSRQS